MKKINLKWVRRARRDRGHHTFFWAVGMIVADKKCQRPKWVPVDVWKAARKEAGIPVTTIHDLLEIHYPADQLSETVFESFKLPVAGKIVVSVPRKGA